MDKASRILLRGARRTREGRTQCLCVRQPGSAQAPLPRLRLSRRRAGRRFRCDRRSRCQRRGGVAHHEGTGTHRLRRRGQRRPNRQAGSRLAGGHAPAWHRGLRERSDRSLAGQRLPASEHPERPPGAPLHQLRSGGPVGQRLCASRSGVDRPRRSHRRSGRPPRGPRRCPAAAGVRPIRCGESTEAPRRPEAARHYPARWRGILRRRQRHRLAELGVPGHDAPDQRAGSAPARLP